MIINHEVTIGTSEKKRQDVFNFKDLTPGIWCCVDKMYPQRQAYAVVYAEREYGKYPRCLIICKETDFDQAFVPVHSSWDDSNWKLCDSGIKISVSFEQED